MGKSRDLPRQFRVIPIFKGITRNRSHWQKSAFAHGRPLRQDGYRKWHAKKTINITIYVIGGWAYRLKYFLIFK